MEIATSELFITEKGTVYHLDLAPGQLAEIIICVGNPDRVKKVSKYFDRMEHQVRHREFITHTGYIGNKRISVVSTGIGPDNIDIVVNELDALANIDLKTRTIHSQKKSLTIIRLGTSGSLQKNIPIDSYVVSSHGIGLDNLLHYYRYQNSQEEVSLLENFKIHTGLQQSTVLPYLSACSENLRIHFTDGFHSGITVTCPGFFGPQGRVLRAPVAFPGLIDSLSTFQHHGMRIANFEMETSARYGLGKILEHQCLSISTVIANRIDKTFSSSIEAIMDKLIKESLAIIEKI